MSDTPRTDAEDYVGDPTTGERVVSAEFARTLERELAARKSRMTESKLKVGKPRRDFSVLNCGSVTVLQTHNNAARAWCDDNLPEDRMTWGISGNVIEPRYLGPILDAIREAGFNID